MASKVDARRKKELVAELNAARTRLAGDVHGTTRSLNVVEHMKSSIAEHKTGWLTGAALTGTLFAWWLRRPRKQVVLSKPSIPAVTTLQIPQKGYVGILLTLFAFGFNLFKPLLSAMAARKIAQMSARAGRRY